MKKLLIIPALLLLCSVGCTYDYHEVNLPDRPDSCIIADTVSFARDVMPIINGSCGTGSTDCHRDNSSSGYSLANYTEVRARITDDTADKFMKRIKHDRTLDPTDWMPKNAARIPQCDINKIERWISQGQLNN